MGTTSTGRSAADGKTAAFRFDVFGPAKICRKRSIGGGPPGVCGLWRNADQIRSRLPLPLTRASGALGQPETAASTITLSAQPRSPK